MKATASAPAAELGAAEKRKLEQKALRDKLAARKQAAKGSVATKPAPAKKAAKKAATKQAKKAPAASVATPPARKRAATPATAPATKKARGPRTSTLLAGMQQPEGSRERLIAGITAIKRKVNEMNAAKDRISNPVRPEKLAPGRPTTVNWDVVDELEGWKYLTNKEISLLVGCSAPNVSIRRKRLIEAEERKGKQGDPSKYVSLRDKWSKTLNPAEILAEASK